MEGSQTGKVYWYNFDKEVFFQLYDFGAVVGDVWTISDEPFTTQLLGGEWRLDSFVEEVISVENMEIAGEFKNLIFTKSISPPSMSNIMLFYPFGTNTNYPIIEGIGSTTDLFGTINGFTLISSGNYGLRCFQSEGIEYRHRAYSLPCDYYNPLTSLAADILSRVSLYPNPCIERLHLEMPPQAEVQWYLYDRQGKALRQGICHHETQWSIEVSDLDSGSYYIDLVFNQQFSKTLKFLKQ